MGNEHEQPNAGSRPGDMPLLPPSGAEAPRRAKAQLPADVAAPVNAPNSRVKVKQSTTPPPQKQAAARLSSFLHRKKPPKAAMQLLGAAIALVIVLVLIISASPSITRDDSRGDVAVARPVDVAPSASVAPTPMRDIIRFDTRAEITFSGAPRSVWHVTLRSPVAVPDAERAVQRVDVVMRLENTTATEPIAIPLDPASGDSFFGRSFIDVPEVPALRVGDDDLCEGDVFFFPLPEDMRLNVGETIRGSVCLSPSPFAASDVPFVHLRALGGDIIWTSDIPAAISADIERRLPTDGRQPASAAFDSVVELPVSVERAREQAIAFDTQAQISFEGDESSVWSVTLSDPVAVPDSALDLQRIDIVIRLDGASELASQWPLDDAFDRFSFSYGENTQLLAASERLPGSCVVPDWQPPLRLLREGDEVQTSLCLPPVPPPSAQRASDTLFVHLHTIGDDIVWTTGDPLPIVVDFER